VSRYGNKFKIFYNKAIEIFNLEKISKTKSGIITIIDDNYPLDLISINKPPLVLFFKGQVKLLENKKIGIVGTRKPSLLTKIWIKKICIFLAQNNMVTVSGLASGIDNIVYHSSQKGGTIAVLPHSITFNKSSFYNTFLRTCFNPEKDLLLSEYYRTEFVQKYFYVHRNRIIAGLCNNLLIAEAGIKSGALITAYYAEKNNRKIFVLCHYLQNNNKGVIDLIKNDTAKDITNFFPIKIHRLNPDETPGYLKENFYYIGNGYMAEFIYRQFSAEFLLPDPPDQDSVL
jgi:DNA processing protein